MKFYVSLIIRFHNQKFVSLVISDFHFRDNENKKVDDFLTISISIVDHIDLPLDNDVINIRFIIQFYVINDFIKSLFYRNID